MDNKRYLTITQFAKSVGISRQTVYNKLDSDLQKYVKIVNDIKYIDLQAYLEDKKPPEEPEEEPQQEEQTEEGPADQLTILNGVIKTLTDQLKIKDEQLKTKDAHIEELTRLLDQQQRLTMADKKMLPDPDEAAPEKPKKRWLPWR